MEVIYFQPPGISQEYCEAGYISESDPEYIWYLDEPCKILISEVKLIDTVNVFYDKKKRLCRVIKPQSVIVESGESSPETENQPTCSGATNKRLFLVTFLGKDERGEIVKGIEVMADSPEDAMNLIKEISVSKEIYSAVEV